MITTPVIIYARFSSPNQERGSSIERQLDLARTHIERMGWTELEAVIDRGRSAWKGHHLTKGNLGELAKRIRCGEFARGTVLLVEKLDRLSRQERRDTIRWLEDMTDCGVGIATVDGARLYTTKTLRDNMMEIIEITLTAELAWKESQQKSERILDAQARKRALAAKTGKVFSKRCPGWLRVVDDRFEIIEDRADIVRQIYQWTADGVGCRGVSLKLQEAGVPSWGKAKFWEPTYISEIIASPAAEGDHQPRRIVDGVKVNTFDKIIGYYPRIVDAELVVRARAGRRTRLKHGGGHRLAFANLFQGLVRCVSCNAPMTMRNGPTARSSLMCSQVYRGRACDQATSIRYRDFEAAALDTILHLALNDRFFSRADESLPLANKVAELEKLLEDQQGKAKRLLKLMLRDDEPDEGMVQERDELQAQIKTTKARLQTAQSELDDARGSADQTQHMRRVMEVRDAINHDDKDIRVSARMKVAQALKSVVSYVDCDTRDDFRGTPEKTYTLVIAGGVRAFKFDDRGNMIAETDLSAAITHGVGGESIARTLAGGDPNVVQMLHTYFNRNKGDWKTEVEMLRYAAQGRRLGPKLVMTKAG